MRLIAKITVLFLCVSFHVALAQSDKYSVKEKSKYWDAENLLIKKDYLGAIEAFKTLENVDQDYAELSYKIGEAYFELEEYQKALPYLRKGAEAVKEAYYMQAYIQLHNEELDSADYMLTKYVKKSRFSKSKIKGYIVEQLKNNIENANQFLFSPEDVNIINLGETVNSKYDEYVPLITSNEDLLLFTSRRDESLLDPYGIPFEDVYSSKSTENRFEWLKAKPIKGAVNTKKHDACVGLSPDGSTLFIFRTNENVITGDLYESILKDGIWTTPLKMSPKINSINSTEPSASISLDGLTFYFSSDREGGYGGFDLYRVKKLPNGEWSMPLNLGPTINTKFDEDAPFIHPNGTTLYFSSKGHKNIGGYDIFKSTLIGEQWGTPENLGVPTNSTKDDIYFSISGNEKHGYYSSEKEGGFGGQDIYVIDYLEKSLHQSVVSSTILLDEKPVDAEVTLFDSDNADMVGVFLPNPNNGKFIFLVNPDTTYELLVEGDGFERYTKTISFSVEELNKKQNLTINLKAQK